ncbi:MAG: type IV toxin-antitoxin system AbiEi family antitoxin [Candidatus Jacksonbacteria bacterium]
MQTKHTILSQKESKLLENLIIKYGVFVNFQQIYLELKKDLSRQEIRNLVSKLSKNGWLVRIKKGMYYIADLTSRGFAGASTLIIAQTLVKDSYISFEAALQYHNMFDQHLKTITSITLAKKRTIKFQDTNYRFIKTNKKLLYGWEKARVEGKIIKIASAEKAILDILHFNRNIYSADLVLEKLQEYARDFNWEKLNQYSQKQSITVIRILGFLLDKIKADSSFLHSLVKDNKGSSYMTKDSQIFNGKWRLYYHKHFR